MSDNESDADSNATLPMEDYVPDPDPDNISITLVSCAIMIDPTDSEFNRKLYIFDYVYTLIKKTKMSFYYY